MQKDELKGQKENVTQIWVAERERNSLTKMCLKGRERNSLCSAFYIKEVGVKGRNRKASSHDLRGTSQQKGHGIRADVLAL